MVRQYVRITRLVKLSQGGCDGRDFLGPGKEVNSVEV
jgi:hypothetical protein